MSFSVSLGWIIFVANETAILWLVVASRSQRKRQETTRARQEAALSDLEKHLQRLTANDPSKAIK